LATRPNGFQTNRTLFTAQKVVGAVTNELH